MGSGSSKSSESSACPTCPSTDCPVNECPDCPECDITLSNNMKVYDILDPIMNHFAPEELDTLKKWLERDQEGKNFFQGSVRSLINKMLEGINSRQKQEQYKKQQDDKNEGIQHKNITDINKTTGPVPAPTHVTQKITTGEGFSNFNVHYLHSSNVKLFIGLCVFVFILFNHRK